MIKKVRYPTVSHFLLVLISVPVFECILIDVWDNFFRVNEVVICCCK